jgi:predicted Zn-dependent protease with MMP-like domain
MSERARRVGIYRAIQQRHGLSRPAFEAEVAAALRGLPVEIRARLENIAVVVEDWPRAADPLAMERGEMMGVYRGIPVGQRGTGYHLATPDRIVIYRGPITAAARDRHELRREIRDTVVHEIGHYFGLDDDELP